MLDFPEEFAPANKVNGRNSILCSSAMDLNPETRISERFTRVGSEE